MMYNTIFIYCSFSIFIYSISDGYKVLSITEKCNDILVNIPQGSLCGKIDVDRYGGNFYSFQGIPYAKPPIKKLRFRDPKPLESWSGILDARKEGNQCTQNKQNQFLGDEDCLFLNVYTPELPNTNDTNNSNKYKSVMVWIHGGSFIENSANSQLFGAKKLIPEDVVLVTLNYRLDVLGFLSLNDSSLNVPGNAGMKDQTMALRWIRNNIKYFSGDSKKILLFGESAGAVSVHLHVLSPISRGLFHAASSESGDGLAFWATGIYIAHIIANELGFNTTNATEEDILTFLESVPKFDLIKAQMSYNEKVEQIPGVSFIGPVIEKVTENNDNEHFLTQHPMQIIQDGTFAHIPLIFGYTDTETMMLLENVTDWQSLIPKNVQDFQTYLPPNMGIVRDSPKSLEAAAKLKNFYFSNVTNSTQELYSYFNMTRDFLFLTSLFQSIRLMASKNTQPVYVYRFSIDTDMNEWKYLNNIHLPGAAHTDDNGYLFSYDFEKNVSYDSIEDICIRRMTKLWSNFAKYGNPNGDYKEINTNHCNKNNIPEQTKEEKYDEIWRNVTWKHICKDSKQIDYLQMNNDQFISEVNPDHENEVFLDQLLKFLNNTE